jgi:hypothetical protein
MAASSPVTVECRPPASWGLIEVPVIVLGHLTKIQIQPLMLADNQQPLNAGWDEAMLWLELEALMQSGFHVPIVGFDQQELDRLLTDLTRHAPWIRTRLPRCGRRQ